MPRNKGTSRKGKPKAEMRSAGFGKALQRSQAGGRRVPKVAGVAPPPTAHGNGMAGTGASTIGIADDGEMEGTRARSVLEMDDLSDFLLQAQLANREFASERERFLDAEGPATAATTAAAHLPSASASTDGLAFQELAVPRRPAWTPGVTTAEELEAAENESFLEWRRALARREEELAARAFDASRQSGSGSASCAMGAGITGASVTPYEKNLHVWRQLWRVLERSAMIVQVVDARNPLFYLSEDLTRYASDELGKPTLALVNKADFLTERQRERWSEYFRARGVEHLFFSARDEQKKIDEAVALAKRGEMHEGEEGEGQGALVSDDDDEAEIDSGSRRDDGGTPRGSVSDETGPVEGPVAGTDPHGIATPLTREQLLDTLDSFARGRGCVPDPKYDDRIQFGMVGFPNVGKSSVINVLVGSSRSLHGVARAAVAAQPGKTKHFQTLLLPDRPDMMLCDCPGLVFPSFVSSAADMVAAGVYPIAQMRDHWPVVSLICDRVPREVLNAHYGFTIPEPDRHELREAGWVAATSSSEGKAKLLLPPPTAEELLGTYCEARSVLAASSGVPDYQRAARTVVRDYSEGKLLYCHAPPALSVDSRGGMASAGEDDEYRRETLITAIRNTSNARKLRKLEQSLEVAAEKVPEGGCGLDGFDDLEGIISEDVPSGDRRGKAHGSIKRWGKKGRKLRNKDPYGCHSGPDAALRLAPVDSGVRVNAGKYGGSYTRADYAGARAASPFKGGGDRPERGVR